MQSVAGFITRALKAKGIKSFMYLDDIILIADSPDLAQQQYNTTIDMLQDLGLQVAHHKLQPPAKIIVWLGITIDTYNNLLLILESKLAVITKCLAAPTRQTKITKTHLQSILDFINHLGKVVRAARIFVAHLLAALRAATTDHHSHRPNIRADMAWFSRYLHANNARAIIPHSRTVLRIWADLSLKRGGGATDRTSAYTYTYHKKMADSHHITHHEAINVLAAVMIFVNDSHATGTVEVYCDNSASISSYSSGRARNPVLPACCRAMWHHAATIQTCIRFAHVPGEAIVVPGARMPATRPRPDNWPAN